MKHLALVLLLAPAAAWAQSAPDESLVDEDGRRRAIKYREREEVDFERGLELEGELVKPSIGTVDGWKRPVFNPLIRLRSDWAVEMRQSVDEVR